MDHVGRIRRFGFCPSTWIVLAALLTPTAAVGDAVELGRGDDRAARAIATTRIDAATVGILVGDERGSRGAGFVWRTGGAIVTAAHVVEGGGDIRVRLPDGRVSAARVLGVDDVADVALLRIDGDPPVPTFARSERLRRGDLVAAVGDPLGFAGTLTVGHVSTPARRWGETSPYDLIQHDAALNPGSSGGPLVDASGDVVGMNLAIADGARRHVGIGFALPIEVVDRIAARLLAEGFVARPRLGLRLRPASSLRATIPTLADGLVTEAVDAGSPAAAAGIAPGDVIVAVDGQRMTASEDLVRLLETKRPGDVLRLDLGAAQGVRTVVLGRRSSPTRALRVAAREAFDPGLSFASETGGRIATVVPGGPAETAGLAVGDEILEIGEHRLDGADSARLLAEAAAGSGGVALLVRRAATTRWVVLGPHGRLDVEAPFGSNAEARTSRLF
ncbi:MAG: trypsin-like peptidase domain-containing protein [Hyphomicrobiales bacterium]|nr:trypsin-like peptidase domain-containing protein [Hyphomicrobiales bacterium]